MALEPMPFLVSLVEPQVGHLGTLWFDTENFSLMLSASDFVFPLTTSFISFSVGKHPVFIMRRANVMTTLSSVVMSARALCSAAIVPSRFPPSIDSTTGLISIIRPWISYLIIAIISSPLDIVAIITHTQVIWQ